MKKLYIILTLMLSSFFFCSVNVNASTYRATVSEDSIALINDDFFEIKKLASQYCEDNQRNYYYIGYSTTDELYYVIFFDSITSTEIRKTTKGVYVSLSFSSGNKYNLIDGVLSNEVNISSSNNTLLIADNIVSFQDYLYSNFEIINNSAHTFSFVYSDYILISNPDEKFSPLYEYYVGVFGEDSEEELPNYEILANFYIILVEKINLLTTSIAENYLYLSIFVVFILIFVIELIRRYLM